MVRRTIYDRIITSYDIENRVNWGKKHEEVKVVKIEKRIPSSGNAMLIAGASWIIKVNIVFWKDERYNGEY